MKSELDKKLDPNKQRTATANAPETSSTAAIETKKDDSKLKRKANSGLQFAFKSMSRR